MDRTVYKGINLRDVPSPCFIIETNLLQNNVRLLHQIEKQAGCKILLALKGFSMFSSFPYIRDYLSGTCASSPWEAELGSRYFKKEVHAFAPAYSDSDIKQLVKFCNHIVFNSFALWERYKDLVLSRGIQAGLRINPEHSETTVAVYNPCAPDSRLGIKQDEFKGRDLSGISGLHFHTLCEKDFPPLARTLDAVEVRFGDYIKQVKWINMGGGHLITKAGYQTDQMIERIAAFKNKYNVDVYLEPGQAVGYNAGVLMATVLEIIQREIPVAILDVSASAHMPDILEMPYRPAITGADLPRVKAYTYSLGGISCLAGDMISLYSFDEPLKPGDKLIFEDMAHYTMVKTTFFNGVHHPALALYDESKNRFKIVRKFTFNDFKKRLS